jgi:hypothetical protein
MRLMVDLSKYRRSMTRRRGLCVVGALNDGNGIVKNGTTELESEQVADSRWRWGS